jgi:hypothetical protein
MEDFFRFTAAVLEERGHVSGKSLLQLFQEAKPSIMKINDFSNPSIPFEKIIETIAIRYLNEASVVVMLISLEI